MQPFSQKDKRVVTVFATPIFNKHTCTSAFMSAAFGTINHDLLWSGLEKHFGIARSVLKWFKSYFYDHAQFVTIKQPRSTTRDLLTGVPQASILGISIAGWDKMI